ncbi:MAG: Uma2 family endonuclease [Acidobacteria bacterium]|nr:Uma2 family endonuclease [Acidobacteriota bacterium]
MSTATRESVPGVVSNDYPQARRLTREEFERAGELGLFGPEERLELIDGIVVRKMTPQNPPHASGIAFVERALRALELAGVHLRIQLPLALGTHAEPEPDIAVVDGDAADYTRDHPASARLVVEVSDTTRQFDRTNKASLYASAGIPEYWILDLPDRALEIMRDPAPRTGEPFGAHYRSVTRHTGTDSVRSLLSNRDIAVAALLPR